MKRTLCLTVAALAFACGGSTKDSAQSGSGTQPVNSANAAAQPEQAVVMTGCLMGDQSPGAVGTSGSATSPADDRVASAAGTGRARFTLANATPAGAAADQRTAPAPTPGTPAGAGVGANGAGGSGGPLVSGISSYALVGNASDLSPHLNHEVRVTGRLSSTTTAYEASDRTPADQVPGPAGTSGPAMRTITVDSIEMVAANCQKR